MNNNLHENADDSLLDGPGGSGCAIGAAWSIVHLGSDSNTPGQMSFYLVSGPHGDISRHGGTSPTGVIVKAVSASAAMEKAAKHLLMPKELLGVSHVGQVTPDS